MIRKYLKDIQEMVFGEGLTAEFENLIIEGVSIDSRTTKKGNLFIPIVRIKDGHNYVREAIKNGATASLWEKNHPNPPKDIPLIFVDKTMFALQSLASSYRNQLPIKVIGITGSNGKTTTKDLVYSIIGTTYKVFKTKGNLNSQIGLPLTILEVSEDDEYLVLEMGMSESGQIKRLSQIAQPDIAIITMIGVAHIASLGSREEIAKAKLEIIQGLKNNGLLIINGDEPLLKTVQYLNKRTFRITTFGESIQNNLHPTSVNVFSDDIQFRVNEKDGPLYTLSMLGRHNVLNALAAIAVGEELGIKDEAIVRGLEDTTITEMRMQKIISHRGLTIINDAWNANPNSVQAAIETFEEMMGYNQKFLVLGDMLELGQDEEEYHKRIGRLIHPGKIDYVFTFGPLSEFLSREAEKNLGSERVIAFSNKGEIANKIINLSKPNDIVLIKGSRGMALENVVDMLL